MQRRIIWILLPFALGACAGGMDVAECRMADWRAIGYEDGAQGRAPQHFGERRRACAKNGVAADFEAYMVGRDDGLGHFCRPQNGYQLGTRGYRYGGVCPAGLEEAFLAAHADGYGLYERNAALKSLRNRLKHSQKRAKDIEYRLAERTAEVVSPDTGVTERAAIVVELKQLAEERVRLDEQIDRIEHELDEAEYDYERYQAYIAARPRT